MIKDIIKYLKESILEAKKYNFKHKKLEAMLKSIKIKKPETYPIVANYHLNPEYFLGYVTFTDEAKEQIVKRAKAGIKMYLNVAIEVDKKKEHIIYFTIYNGMYISDKENKCE